LNTVSRAEVVEEAKPEMVSARDKHYLPPLDQGMFAKNKSFMLRMNDKHYLPPLDQGMFAKNKSFMLRMNNKDDNLK